MARLLTFTPSAWADYLHWQEQDKKTIKRINQLMLEVVRDPFTGIGKPEPLRGDLSGFWSRRIDEAHRLVYCASDSELTIIACRFHYDG